ncbi:MAG: pseudouridine synthase [Candidatus Shikimatogenerans bostrichidophilus]|nr:MAG: pseudouridine synthase [Candidatus Shikimatogenerans bostrichidophilus]
MNKYLRLNNYISKCGICSRRKADSLIKLGFIKVNGKIINTLGYKVLLNNDIIKYNNKIINIKKKIYLLINKPKNCITTLKDNKNRNNIMNYIPYIYKKYGIYPIGRLDKNTTGILLLTNDGKLSKKLTHPKYKIKKTYNLILNKNLKFNDYLKIKKGFFLKEGKIQIEYLNINKKNKKNITLTIKLGWNKIVHRIFKKIGYKIVYLDRINFAGIKKPNIKTGKYIVLSKKKIDFIKKINKL